MNFHWMAVYLKEVKRPPVEDWIINHSVLKNWDQLYLFWYFIVTHINNIETSSLKHYDWLFNPLQGVPQYHSVHYQDHKLLHHTHAKYKIYSIIKENNNSDINVFNKYFQLQFMHLYFRGKKINEVFFLLS
jgi:hypothetical protein